MTIFRIRTGISFITQDISNLISSSAIQIAVGVIDLCSSFYPLYPYCSYNPTPWIDNVKLLRFKSLGPQWWYSDHTLFQDNFPPTSDLEGKIRADVAIDNYHSGNGKYCAGDSAVVSCSSPLGGGIAIDNTGAHIGDRAVYMHVKATYVATDGNPLNKPMQIFGPVMQGDCGWFDSDDGSIWTILQCDQARIKERGISEDRYMVDLNDSLFTRGYRIEYYFTAIDNHGRETALPWWARSSGPYFEWTCLPTYSSKVLFVNAYDGICASEGPADVLWKSTFNSVLPSNNQPDVFHINSPASRLCNGLASRAKPEHLKPYLTIIWESGDLYDGMIYENEKCNDNYLLSYWGNFSAYDLGLWFCGDNIARKIDSGYFTMLSIWLGLNSVYYNSYYDETGGRIGGGIISPLLKGNPESGIFVHNGIPDELFLEGGCPLINSFDILEKEPDAKYALDYPSYMGIDYHAALSNHLLHDRHAVKAVLFGFSLISVRDAVLFPQGPIVRFGLAADVFNWMSVPINSDITQAEPPIAYRLEQNYPNPFNPITTIHFAMKEKSSVTLKVYNVAGQLVRTLVDDVMEASDHTIIWDGRNNAGSEVASGIYFYKMATKDFSQTRKLVLLR